MGCCKWRYTDFFNQKISPPDWVIKRYEMICYRKCQNCDAIERASKNKWQYQKYSEGYKYKMKYVSITPAEYRLEVAQFHLDKIKFT